MSTLFYIARGELDARPLTPYRPTKEAALADMASILGEHPLARICTLMTWED